MSWTLADMQDQSGKVAIVTGANSGIGLGAATALASRGATVVMACRSEERANQAIATIIDQHPNSQLAFIPLDLSSLQSVTEFCQLFSQQYNHCDLLINNAGVMIPPLQRTVDGFESQIGINFLAHFALTGQLMPQLEAADNARVISLASLAHHSGKLSRDNFNAEKNYYRIPFYAQSKLACLVFALEFQRRLKKHGCSTQSLAAHPGVTSTELGRNIPFLPTLMKLFLQSADNGALPTLQAATDPDAMGGDYYGPTGRLEYAGPSGKAKISRLARDPKEGKWLWKKAQQLTGINYL